MRSALIRILFSLLILMLLAGCGNGNGSSNNNFTSTIQMGGAKQGSVLTLKGILSTLAGRSTWGTSLDGIGAAAWFNGPQGITTDGTNLYVVDTNNQSIRKVVIATGAVTTLAGSERVSGSADGTGSAAQFYHPSGITTDGVSLYVTDSFNNTIRRVVIATGAVTTLAGSAGTVGMLGSADGIGSAAQFYNPTCITTDGTNLYIVDSGNYTIRKVVIVTGTVTTLAGSARVSGTTDGTGTLARFSASDGITTDGANLYVTDLFNNTIRKVEIATGTVTTLAGSAGMNGNTDGTGSSARFRGPRGITTDGTYLYVADANTIRKVGIATGTVTTLAGSQSSDLFISTFGITSDGANLYISDSNTIRKVVISTGAVTTLAGINSGSFGSADGTGTAARFDYPSGLTTDGANLYVADSNNHTIRKVVIATGVVTTLVGSVGTSGSIDGTGSAACFNVPSGITTDGKNLFISDSYNHTIRKVVIATGTVTTLAGTAGASGSTDGTGSVAKFSYPWGITTDGTNVFVADSNNHSIRQVVIATGVVTTLAGTAGTSGSIDGIGSGAFFNVPVGTTTDGVNVYVTDSNNHTIRQVVIATGAVTTLAGTAGTSGSTDGIGSGAFFNVPVGITTDGKNLYVADLNNHTIRKVVIATGTVTTQEPNPLFISSPPIGLTTDGTKLYVTISANNTIHVIE